MRRGERCRHAHGRAELREFQDLAPNDTERSPDQGWLVRWQQVQDENRIENAMNSAAGAVSMFCLEPAAELDAI